MHESFYYVPVRIGAFNRIQLQVTNRNLEINWQVIVLSLQCDIPRENCEKILRNSKVLNCIKCKL